MPIDKNKAAKIKDFKLFDLDLSRPAVKAGPVPPGNGFPEFAKEDIHRSIPDRFERQVRQYPHRTAVKNAGGYLTYKQLNEKANRLAHAVVDRCGPEPAGAALLFDHDAGMIAAIMGTLKSGKYYIPLDPAYPFERSVYMLKDSNAGLLVTCGNNQKTAEAIIKAAGKEILLFNVDGLDNDLYVCTHNLNLAIPPANPAYILYTSGSTGKPKGVLQNHRNVLHFVRVYTNALHIHPGDKLTLFSSYGFDAAKMDIYGALLNGAGLYPYDIKKEDNLVGLPRWLGKEEITIYHSIPTVYRYFTALLGGAEEFKGLRFIVLGGEAVYRKDVEVYKRYFPDDCILINGLGPTESTVTLQYFIDKKKELTREAVPVGYPVDETEVALIDEEDKETQGYGLGEIVFKSPYLTPGYLNNPQLTSNKFCLRRPGGSFEKPPPGFSRLPAPRGRRQYKTGDMGRRLMDGSIEYVGRKDFQVKVRGFRIELAEIEGRLDQVGGIKKSVVVCTLDRQGENYLTAYYVVSDAIEENHLVGELKKSLPGYMIPGAFFRLDGFPYTSTGKIDRKALADSIRDWPVKEYTAPGGGIETVLANIWKELLQVERVGVDDNFFVLGGNSLKAIMVSSHLHKKQNVKLPLAEIFKRPTIKELAQYINRAGEDKYVAIAPVEEKEYYELSPAQERFYFLQQMDLDSTAFNLTQVLPLGKDIYEDKLETALKKLIRRHETLRTSFEVLDEKPVQRIQDRNYKPLNKSFVGSRGISPRFSKEPLAAGGIIKNFVSPFDLSKAPLMRSALIGLPDHSYTWIIDMHHIISDGTSLTILAKDFAALYEGEALTPLRLRYRDFSGWQNRLIASNRVKQHEEFWLQNLQGKLPLLEMPTDFPRPAKKSYEGARFNFGAGKELHLQMKKFIKEREITLYILLLTVYNILLYRYGGQRDIIIGSPVAGRNHADLENIVGLVMGSVMMRNFPGGGKTFERFLEEVTENTLNAFEHQAYPYEELLKKVRFEEQPGRNPIADAGLIVQNMLDQEKGGEIAEGEPVFYATSKLDITLTAVEVEEDVIFTLEYCTALFKEETMKRFSRHFVNILKEVVKERERGPGLLLAEIDLMGAEEKRRLLGTPAKCFPLSHPQKRIYYTEKKYPGTNCHTIAFTVRYREEINKEILQAAVNKVLQKNDGLRLRIVEFDFQHEPAQYIAPWQEYHLDTVDFRGQSKNGAAPSAEQIDTITAKPFHLLNSDLFYFALARFNQRETGYYMKLHHIISDGWTCYFLFKEIDKIYEDIKAGKAIVHEPNPSYIQYTREELKYLESSRAGEDREYWYKNLLPLPPAAVVWWKKSVSTTIKGAASYLLLPEDLRRRVQHYCRDHNTTVYKLFFCVLSIYISRVTGLDDIVTGSVNHNRTTEKYKQTAGMFVSTLPIRVKIDGSMVFRRFVKEIGEEIDGILKNHQKYPFDVLAGGLREETGTDPGYLLNINLIGHTRLGEKKFKVAYHFPKNDPNPLTIHINISDKDIRGILELEYNYQVELFSRGDIERLHQCLVNILDNALCRPGKRIAEIELVSEKEKEKILYEFNDTAAVDLYPEDRSIRRLFEEQAERTPDHVALVGGIHVSYKELNNRSGGLAYLLKRKGVRPDTIVGLKVGRSVEMIIGILGILKAGGAYLPIDPGYPEERKRYILKDSGAKMLEIESPLHPSPFTLHPSPPTSLAYIIYTSGSTGRPKGVLVEQRNLTAYIHAFEKEFSLQADDVVLQQASFCFDAFVEEMYPILLKGGRLAIPGKKEVRDIHLLTNFIIKHNITLITCSPLMLNELNTRHNIRRVRIFISGGDVLKREYIDNLLSRAKVYNTYGPTEAAVCATYHRCGGEDPPNVPIGKPITNYNIFILDRYGQLLPVGIPGELCISGPGVTRGYLNNPELTAEKFILPQRTQSLLNHEGVRRINMSSMSHLSCIYHTGDLARWLSDGNIEFIDRMDSQVSIRGYRIEPGEIESRLIKHKDIKEAVVIAREDKGGDRYLCAYVVLDLPHSPLFPGLKEFLSQTLPDYMIPAYFVKLEKIPLTLAGKPDRKALPEPGNQSIKTHAAPRDQLEENLAKIWSEVLNIDGPVGIDDNFFHRGGHSLKAAKLVSRVRSVFNVKIPLEKIFQSPTIRDLSGYIKRAVREQFAPIKPVEEKEYYPLSPGQKRLYIMQQMGVDYITYNESTTVELEGDLDRGKLRETFKGLISRHESLRASFEIVNDEPVQRIHKKVEFEIENHSAMRHTAFVRPFDLTRVPLLRVGLGRTSGDNYILMLDMHHIISDGASMTIFVREFIGLYEGKTLPVLRIRYKDFCRWQDNLAASGEMEKQGGYWLRQFGGDIPRLNLNSPAAAPAHHSLSEGAALSFEIGKELTVKIKRLARETGATLFMVLLAVYNILLSKYTGQQDIIVGSGIAGRRHEDLQHVIGMFVNMLALRNRPEENKLFTAFLAEVKENALNAYDNQDYPFDQLVEKLAVAREFGRNPIFDTQFTFRNFADEVGERAAAAEPEPGPPGVAVKSYVYGGENKKMQFHLSLNGTETNDNIFMTFYYVTALFKEPVIREMTGHYIEILSRVLEDGHIRLKDIEISHDLQTGKSILKEEELSDYDF